MAAGGLGGCVAAVRRFNRFYTRQIGVLDGRLNRSPFSLAEARVLYELAQHPDATATALGAGLGLDAGYLSRILAGLERRGLVWRHRSRADARRSHLRLTAPGRAAFARLDAAARRDVRAMLGALDRSGQARLIAAMRRIEALLGGGRNGGPVTLRSYGPGDLGWVVERHGALYAEEYGWGARFEALVADIVARFVRCEDRARERCWIAERDGERLGCVFLVKKTARVAQLRLLLVEPAASGSGLGRRLVDECTRFARRAGYRKIVLWTNGVLDAARHIYATAGYRLVRTDRHDDLGTDPNFEVWDLDLGGAPWSREPRSGRGVSRSGRRGPLTRTPRTR
ncbi:MAG TPA: helix-turn-helix domain-containing GNAT family N-acetyltransferase [Gemmatimonadales bacterium]|nr:helix-turn-helix domain-containing GNAT family N-acetyltransferase [Gemmatimonadales bacterium]